MYTKEDMIMFATWWYGPGADGCFPGQGNITTEQGFDYWVENIVKEDKSKSCPLYVDYKKSCEALKKHKEQNA